MEHQHTEMFIPPNCPSKTIQTQHWLLPFTPHSKYCRYIGHILIVVHHIFMRCVQVNYLLYLVGSLKLWFSCDTCPFSILCSPFFPVYSFFQHRKQHNKVKKPILLKEKKVKTGQDKKHRTKQFVWLIYLRKHFHSYFGAVRTY